MAMHFCRNFRPYAVSLAAQKSPIGARFCHSSVAGGSVSGGIQPDFYGGAVGGTAFVAWLFYWFDFRGWRTWSENNMEEARRLEFKLAKEGLEAIEREIHAMKAKRHERAAKEILSVKLSGDDDGKTVI